MYILFLRLDVLAFFSLMTVVNMWLLYMAAIPRMLIEGWITFVVPKIVDAPHDYGLNAVRLEKETGCCIQQMEWLLYCLEIGQTRKDIGLSVDYSVQFLRLHKNHLRDMTVASSKTSRKHHLSKLEESITLKE
ncbi:hypothetical protein Tco_1042209 [Tanacetum coccineum]|uniref:Uncharacterized protein n=1 Tax=Tanacetum coccineum TaxID=301880 RepID=A0ABQ5GJW6_9ASTR